jgi:hypothetical protein
VLEALEIGSTGEGVVGTLLKRRPDVINAVRWLCYRGERGKVRLAVTWHDGVYLTKEVQIHGGGHNEIVTEANRNPDSAAKPIEQRIGRTTAKLHSLFTETRIRGGLAKAVALLQEVDRSITQLEILTEGDTPVLHLSYDDRSVPVALAGDGMESLVRLALELSQRERGIFLIEEPESHQHTAAIVRSARIIAAAARLGCQIIFATHSMELLDAILASLAEKELDLLAVYRLRLVHGELKVLRMAGKEVNAARAGIEDDLR